MQHQKNPSRDRRSMDSKGKSTSSSRKSVIVDHSVDSRIGASSEASKSKSSELGKVAWQDEYGSGGNGLGAASVADVRTHSSRLEIVPTRTSPDFRSFLFPRVPAVLSRASRSHPYRPPQPSSLSQRSVGCPSSPHRQQSQLLRIVSTPTLELSVREEGRIEAQAQGRLALVSQERVRRAHWEGTRVSSHVVEDELDVWVRERSRGAEVGVVAREAHIRPSLDERTREGEGEGVFWIRLQDSLQEEEHLGRSETSLEGEGERR